MHILTVLSAIGRVETKVGEFYQWLSETFSDDIEAAGFFFRMSMQEKSHANLVSFSKKLVQRDPGAFEEVDLDLGVVDELLDSIDGFRSQNPKPSMEDALIFAMKIESHGAESIHRTLIIQSNPDVASVINSLANADNEHHELLRAFANRREAVSN